MIRVLQVVDNLAPGGIQSFIMNVYRRIDRSKIQFDFLLNKRDGNTYVDEVENLGGRVFFVPSRSQGILKNRRALDNFFEVHHAYQAVHMHESSLSYIRPLVSARKYGIPIRIIHSHNTRVPGSKLHLVLHKYHQQQISKIATNYLACGLDAAAWMYGRENNVAKKCEIVYNGIELEKFSYSEARRRIMRDRLGLSDGLVVIHAGRFEPVKNHRFILTIFAELLKQRPDAWLILCGTGSLLNDIKQDALNLNIQDRVKFLGIRNDLYDLYQAADAFVLPSLYEGFPVSAIEAQASGLSCYLSDTVTKEAKINENVHFVSIKDGPDIWADRLQLDQTRVKEIEALKAHGFDIDSAVHQLEAIYTGKKED